MHPMATISSSFDNLAGLRSCCYKHYASKNALAYTIFRQKKLKILLDLAPSPVDISL